MVQLICSKCMKVHKTKQTTHCPICNAKKEHIYIFNNSDIFIRKEVPRIVEERKNLGPKGLVVDLQCVFINTEPFNWKNAIQELLQVTGLHHHESFQTNDKKICVLTQKDSADIIIQQRLEPEQKNPFVNFNQHPKSKKLPNNR